MEKLNDITEKIMNERFGKDNVISLATAENNVSPRPVFWEELDLLGLNKKESGSPPREQVKIWAGSNHLKMRLSRQVCEMLFPNGSTTGIIILMTPTALY
mgnify:CR=1 FL=1